MNAFHKLHEALTTALILIYYDSDLLICIETDTFKITLIEMLLQQLANVKVMLKH